MNLLPGVLFIVAGVAVIANAAIGRRPAPAPAVRPPLADLTARVTRSYVSLYRGHGPDIELVAVWRWNRRRRRLVPFDPRDLSWSPDWSLELAERAWWRR